MHEHVHVYTCTLYICVHVYVVRSLGSRGSSIFSCIYIVHVHCMCMQVVINFHDDYSTEVIIYEPGKVHTNFMYIGLSMMLGCKFSYAVTIYSYRRMRS